MVPVDPLAELPEPELEPLLDPDGEVLGVEPAPLPEAEAEVPEPLPPVRLVVVPVVSEPSDAVFAAADSIPNFAEAAMMPTETTLRIDFVVFLTRQTPLSESALRGFRRASNSFRPS